MALSGTFGQKVIEFLEQLRLDVRLPEDIMVLDPFTSQHEGAADIWRIIRTFYGKYYNDNAPRQMIIGINPGRLGAGSTGLPFTDTIRLEEFCGIAPPAFRTHEPSSVFVYDVINAFGGPEVFYRRFYITSICPLGFVRQNNKGNWVNWNYYDDKKITGLLEPFMIREMEKQLQCGISRDRAFVLGTGKNFEYIHKLNQQTGWFDEVIPMEHPRYVMQYKAKRKEQYVQKFLDALEGA